MRVVIVTKTTISYHFKVFRVTTPAAMEDEEFSTSLEVQRKVKVEALGKTLYRPVRLISDKSARFSGFRQRLYNYEAGERLSSGALPLSIDIAIHESVPMVLDNGTTMYSDIFLPSRFQDLSSVGKPRVPALVAWYGIISYSASRVLFLTP